MKRFQFLLLDAGPIIKLFELGIWDEFIARCDVTISRTVAKEAKYASLEFEDICVNLDDYEEKGLIRVFDSESSLYKDFYEKFDQSYKSIIHPGEKETLAFLYDSSENWLVCSTDKAVFRVLGVLGKAEQGISLEEILKTIGLEQVSSWKNITPRDKEWKYTKKFKEKWTRKGQVDFIQDQGLV